MDWDQDGNLDIISGCYWTDEADGAHLQILMGKGKMDFAESVSLKSVTGKPLQNVEVAEGTQAEMKAICTQQHAVDYDNDGDLDLVVGCFGPEFFLWENKAEEENIENSIVDEAVELPLKSPDYHSAPHLVDWDGDGDLDLLSGCGGGGVLLSENTGTREEPVWSEFKQLIEGPETQGASFGEGDEIKMNSSTRVWATDYNGDGLLDLLVGDMATISRPAEGVSKTEWMKRKSEDDKKMQKLSEKMQEFYPKLEELQAAGKEPDEELTEKMQELSQQMSKIYESKSEYDATKSTGFVWLLIRKAESVNP